MLEGELAADPIAQFSAWFEAAAAAGAQQPDAAALATVSAEGQPSVRMVLLKGWDRRGFRFFTNHESRKGRELAFNPRAALAVYWREVGRQARVVGTVRRLGRRESAAYFHSRPLESQVAALVSPQSSAIPSRDFLDAAFRLACARHRERPLPLPAHWGGYALRPLEVEFWEHQEHRLHDRIRFVRAGSSWRRERLAP